jgi:DNA-formamidopyrimidine glycosylase
VPEGHAVHRLARAHGRLLTGRAVAATSPQGRFATGATQIDGQVVSGVEARGKHLLYEFRDLPERLHVHLGIYGRFSTGALPSPEPRGALRLRLTTDAAWLDLRGPAACELLTPEAVDRLADRLGPDPLRPADGPERAYRRIARSRAPIGTLLLDQSVLAGVGNIYRAEVLFLTGIAPHRSGNAVTADEWEAVWRSLARLMRSGVRAGRIVTTRPEHRARRSGAPSRADSFYVYGRGGLPCRVCGTAVVTGTLAARAIAWCPRCQPD